VGDGGGLANADTPSGTAPAATFTRSPVSGNIAPLPATPSLSGLPVAGGLGDSLVGIATGTYYGAADATVAVVNSLTGGAV
jgi:hypothetical protein